MDINTYFEGTKDTWNYTPVETHEDINKRLQLQAVLLGATGEYIELGSVLLDQRKLSDKEFNAANAALDIIDETSDILYYVTRGFDSLDKYDVFLNYVYYYKQLYSEYDNEELMNTVNKISFTINNSIIGSPELFAQMYKPVFRNGKEFNTDWVVNYLDSLLNYVVLWGEVLYRTVDYDINDIMQYNYNKLHNKENLQKRGLEYVEEPNMSTV